MKTSPSPVVFMLGLIGVSWSNRLMLKLFTQIRYIMSTKIFIVVLFSNLTSWRNKNKDKVLTLNEKQVHSIGYV